MADTIIWNNYDDTVLGVLDGSTEYGGYEYYSCIIVYVNGNPINTMPSESTYRIQYWKVKTKSLKSLDLNDYNPIMDFSVSGRENPRDLEIMYGKLLRNNISIYKIYEKCFRKLLDRIEIRSTGGKNVAVKPLKSYLKGLTTLVDQILAQEGLPERDPMDVEHISQRKKGYSHVRG